MIEQGPELVWLFLPKASKDLSWAFVPVQGEPVDETYLRGAARMGTVKMKDQDFKDGLDGLRSFRVLIESTVNRDGVEIKMYSLEDSYYEYMAAFLEELDNY